MSEIASYYAHGKLLLSGEYFILNGAVGLAVPSFFGQRMTVQETPGWPGLKWQSYDNEGQLWFEATFSESDFRILKTTDPATAERLQEILTAIFELRSGDHFLHEPRLIQTSLEFPRDWGLGSSSTLIALLAQWAGVDPYVLLERTFGGSGYDLACATSSRPLLYQRREGQGHVISVPFSPPFREKLHFVYLNRKQNSREGIRRFRAKVNPTTTEIDFVSDLSFCLLTATDLPTFQSLIDIHEDFIAWKLDLPKVKDETFPDFPGTVKSLGAWGGDFILAASEESPEIVRTYFKNKGMDTVLGFGQLVLA